MWFFSNNNQVLFVIILAVNYDIGWGDAISNTNFNSHLRDYSAVDINNLTNVKTLQKEDLGKYATFTPASNPIKFKEIPDSALSSSSNGRGLLYHDQPGYAINEYEEGPHYNQGHDYHLYDHHSEPHGPPTFEHDHHNSYPLGDHHNSYPLGDHHNNHDYHDYHGHGEHLPSHDHGHHYSGHKHHHSGHGYYDKHYKHALAAKTVLWPIAGIALLGAAAALVSNPILLQLGVVSGKRRRRDTEEVTGPDFPSDTFSKYEDKIKEQSNENTKVHVKENLRKNMKQNRILKIASLTETTKRKLVKTNNVKDVPSNGGVRKVRSSVKRNVDQLTASTANYNTNNDDDRFIPIPIKLRTPEVTD